ncbi:hypothetical protein RSAG8_13487, partial [Rhizoctonia solani AG-8 WAC10335]
MRSSGSTLPRMEFPGQQKMWRSMGYWRSMGRPDTTVSLNASMASSPSRSDLLVQNRSDCVVIVTVDQSQSPGCREIRNYQRNQLRKKVRHCWKSDSSTKVRNRCVR